MEDIKTEEGKSQVKELIKIEIDDEKMLARLTVGQPSPEQLPDITPELIYSIVQERGIQFGIRGDVFYEIVNQQQWQKEHVVAKGEPPVKGQDARLEFMFPTENSLKPKIDKDGKVNYREVSTVHSVEKDAGLVRKIPATTGKEGKNVLGEVIKTVDGNDVVITPGGGTYKDKEDENVLRASEEGVVFYSPRDNTIEVQQIYIVNQCLDFSIGNLNVKSSVEINGDVRPGFSITTPHNIEVKGVIEHAYINCGGILTATSGITGNQQTKIEVGGDIHAGYIHNQSVTCGGSVYAAYELRNSIIDSADEVVVAKSNGVIIGGHISACNKIVAPIIGSEEGIPTEISVGVNSDIRTQYFNKESEKMEYEEKLQEVRDQAQVLAMKSKLGNSDVRIIRLGNKWKKISQEIGRLESEMEELETQLYTAPNPGIYVSDRIYPGTVLRIKYVVYQVHKELPHAVFKLKGGRIIMQQ